MLDVRLAGVPGAGGEAAAAVADLDEVTEQVSGIMTGGLVPVVTVPGRD
jgi:hypothetical protein